jgi:phosphoesterase RecJ-like protein
MLKVMIEKLRAARSVVLSTHRQCDGDGLGAQIAFFHALRKLGKDARIINVDRPSKKYAFLEIDRWVDVYVPGSPSFEHADLALIMDTNDGRLVEPLFSELKSRCKEVCFIDHHPVLAKGPPPTPGSIIDVSAASTGELCFRILQEMGVELDAQIARALYTSVVFDTQLFRFVKSHPASHLMAAELLKYEREPEEVHRKLFANYSVEKLQFLLRALGNAEYFASDRIAFIPLRAAEFAHQRDGLDRDESGDVIDQIMNVGSVEVAALLREDGPSSFKLSLRSRGTVEVLSIAETFGGGGHRYASGAYLRGNFEELRATLLRALEELVPRSNEKRNVAR